MPSYPEIALDISVVRPGATWGVEAEIKQICPYDTLQIATPEGFEVCDFTVAGESQVLGYPVPASVFERGLQMAMSARGTPIHRLPSGTRVGIRVRNLTEEQRSFRAKLLVAPGS